MAAISRPIKTQMYTIVFWQLIAIAVFALAILLLQGMHKGLSVLLGGLTYWIPTFLFIWRVTNHAGARAATRFLIAFFTWETVKLLLSGILFVLIVKYMTVEVLYAMAGFVGAIVAFWIVSIFSLLNQGANKA